VQGDIDEAIRDLQFRAWDPLGISGNLRLRDEYDGYVPGICKLIARKATRHELAEHLDWIEAACLGGPGDRRHNGVIVERLIRLGEQGEAEI